MLSLSSIAPPLIAAALALTALPAGARADDGAIDQSFGSGGVVTQSLSTTVGHPDAAGFKRVIRQPDGKLVGVGFARFGTDTRVLLARYTADGALDRGFSGGLALLNVPGAERTLPADVLSLPDGGLLVVGTAFSPGRSDIFLARYLVDGRLDASFGRGGIAVDRALQDNTNSFTDARANAAVLLPGTPARVAVVGSVQASALVPSFLVAIYDLGGRPLSRQSFSPRLPAEATDVIADPDGRIVVAGVAADAFEIARFFPNGDLDHPQFTSDTFGRGTFPDSQSRFPGATRARANTLARQPTDGRYVLAGYAVVNGRTVPALARFNRTGGLDTGFGAGGMVTTPLTGSGAFADVTVQPDGRIVATGSSTVDGQTALFTARYLPDGRLDTSFGGDGLVLTRLDGSFDDSGASVLRLADGRLVVAGADTSFASEHRYLITRYGQAPACTPLLGCATVTLVDPTTALVLPDLTQPTKVGILVRRVSGRRLVRVGRVPLGLRHPGGRPIRWHLRVAGHRLPAGRYVINVRALRQGRVVEVGPPSRIVIG
jgi:uncharacterized delta-60 repeat protein